LKPRIAARSEEHAFGSQATHSSPWYTVSMEPIVTTNPNVMHGTPCFAGTRVAVQTFFDHLEAGYTIEEFVEQFPTVRREQVAKLLTLLRDDVARVAVTA
jgi:uncharacterized protein (DUF433 family)